MKKFLIDVVLIISIIILGFIFLFPIIISIITDNWWFLFLFWVSWIPTVVVAMIVLSIIGIME